MANGLSWTRVEDKFQTYSGERHPNKMALDAAKAQMVAELEIEMMTDLYNRWVRFFSGWSLEFFFWAFFATAYKLLHNCKDHFHFY